RRQPAQQPWPGVREIGRRHPERARPADPTLLLRPVVLEDPGVERIDDPFDGGAPCTVAEHGQDDRSPGAGRPQRLSAPRPPSLAAGAEVRKTCKRKRKPDGQENSVVLVHAERDAREHARHRSPEADRPVVREQRRSRCQAQARREPVRTRLPPHGQADDHEDEGRRERLGDARNATHEREKEPRSESVHRGHRHAGRQEGGTRQTLWVAGAGGAVVLAVLGYCAWRASVERVVYALYTWVLENYRPEKQGRVG